MLRKSRWKQGGGEFLGYTVSVVLMCELFLLLVSFSLYQDAAMSLENAVAVISRDIVSCESLAEARERARRDARACLGEPAALPKDGIKVSVDYAPGSETEWKKGNYLTVCLTGEIVTYEPFTSGERKVSSLVMIERNGEK